MNEQRIQAYLTLIQQLLNCTSEAEWQQCLTDNQELLDQELVQVMLEVAEDLTTQGYLDKANFLMNLAGQMMGVYDNKSEVQLKFLLQVLQTTEQSNSNPEVVYPLLQNNLDKLDETFAEGLYQWATATLPTLESEQAYGVAEVIFEFSTLIVQFPLGNRGSNLEIAIKGYQAVGSVFTRDAFPSEWANTQNNLGNVYQNKIRGEKAGNLEEAIACLQESLKVYTPDAFPYEWARTQNNLGAAYANRIKGEKSDNLEAAIACLQESLKVYTPETFPYEWANTQNNLGTAYRDRIKAEKADNLEAAIACLQESFKVYIPDAFPYEWARTQMNLGSAYNDRILGDKVDNSEEAITCLRASLKVYTPDGFPDDWAMTQMNLGNAYSKRFRGDKADNLEEAITCLRASLKVYTPDGFPDDWARTQMNLGNVYTYRIRGEKADNLEKAITCLQESLKIRTLDAFPYEWARTQNNLGNAYNDRIRGEKADNLEAAIACFQESLKVYTPNAFPDDWEMTQNNLGNVYRLRIRGEKAKNKQLAIKAYKSAIEAIEISRSWAMTLQSKQEVMEAVIDVYYNIVQEYLNTEQIPRAIEYVERSKTRNLVELLTGRDIKPRGEFSPAILKKLDRLRHEIRTEQISLTNQEQTYDALIKLGQSSQTSHPDRTRLKQLQQELDKLIERDISLIDPTFSLTQKVESIPFSDIQSLIDKHTAIVEWYITRNNILTFLVTHHSPEPQVWQSSTEDLTNLVNWVNEYIRTYYTNRQQWRNELETRLPKLAEILHLDEIFSLVPKECGSEALLQADRLILVPHNFLHLLPLHALPVSTLSQVERRAGSEDKYLLDLFPRGVQYAPSCQLLKLAQSQQRRNFQNLFAIQNPTEDLIYTDLEVETIRSFFPNAEVLARQTANEASLKLHPNLSLANCVHFSCHGTFNSVSPLESALVLAEDEANTEDSYLTLAEIFELSLQQCRLVTLSACETGFTLPSLSDEYIGLPNGFLFAGSPSVVSSLWTVSDLSTAFLMVKFYENLPQYPQAGEVAIALKQAQKWLRDLTYREFEQELIKPRFQKAIAQLQQKFSPADFFELEDAIEVERKKLNQFEPDDKPFANPFYWAAFVATGV